MPKNTFQKGVSSLKLHYAIVEDDFWTDIWKKSFDFIWKLIWQQILQVCHCLLWQYLLHHLAQWNWALLGNCEWKRNPSPSMRLRTDAAAAAGPCRQTAQGSNPSSCRRESKHWQAEKTSQETQSPSRPGTNLANLHGKHCESHYSEKFIISWWRNMQTWHKLKAFIVYFVFHRQNYYLCWYEKNIK